jgi:ABC-2 type transport system permease protein
VAGVLSALPAEARILIRMKLAIMRHSMTGGKAAWMIVGGVLGLALAAATIWLGLALPAQPTVVADLLAAVYLMWALGWVVGPVWGGSTLLRADHFGLLPVPRRRLAVGLLAAAFVGVTAAVTLLAFLSLVGYAVRLSPASVLVALPAVVLQLVFVVLLSRVATVVFGVVAKSRTGAAFTGVLIAAMMVLAQSGWMVAVAIQVSGVLDTGFGPGFARTVRAVPSGWGVVAVESAARGSWWSAVGALIGLVLLIVLLLLAWSRSLGTPRRARVTIRGSRRVAAPRRGLFAGRTGAVLRKELRTWWRDPQRTQSVFVPLAWALGTTALPLTFGEKVLLPWAAPALALMAGASVANLYGQDGTALWLTLLTGSERADLRGRQLAYLLIFGPVTLAVAVGFTAWSGLVWAWPWVLALVPAMLGGGAGLGALLSVVALAPGPDAHKRPENPLEHGDTTGQANLMFWGGLLPGIPAATVLALGTVYDDVFLLWAGVPVGVATGVFLAWWLGRVAVGRLRAGGPELLFLMRTGRSRPARAELPKRAEVSKGAARTALLGWTLGSIALFPQGLVPMIFLLVGVDVKSWFLAMHVPGAYAWPIATVMVLLGSYLYFLAIKASRKPRATPGQDQQLESV